MINSFENINHKPNENLKHGVSLSSILFITYFYLLKARPAQTVFVAIQGRHFGRYQ